MSYPFTLDDVPDKELYNELMRRRKAFACGKCSYCMRRLLSMPACKYPDRHNESCPLVDEDFVVYGGSIRGSVK